MLEAFKPSLFCQKRHFIHHRLRVSKLFSFVFENNWNEINISFQSWNIERLLLKHKKDENITLTAARIHVFEPESKRDLQHYCRDKVGFNIHVYEIAIKSSKKLAIGVVQYF